MKNELQSLRLFSPLFPHIYRKSEWGDLDDYREDLSAGELLEYEDEILERIEKEIGRKQKSINGYTDRIIDIDIVLYGDVLIQSKILEIPHKKHLLE